MKTKQTFDEYLRKGNLSENTITSYLWTVNYFTEHYDTVNKENLLASVLSSILLRGFITQAVLIRTHSQLFGTSNGISSSIHFTMPSENFS